MYLFNVSHLSKEVDWAPGLGTMSIGLTFWIVREIADATEALNESLQSFYFEARVAR